MAATSAASVGPRDSTYEQTMNRWDQGTTNTWNTVGWLDAAGAHLITVDLGCDVLTSQPGLHAGLAGGGPIISL